MNPLQQIYGLQDQTALITGGGSGIGFAIASCLYQAGANVIIAGRRKAVLDEACKKLGPRASSVVLDVADLSAIPHCIGDIQAKYGAIDILVNNAGNTVKKPFDESSMDDFDGVFDVHVRGPLELTRQIIKNQIVNGGGRVLFISSMTAFISQPNVLPYTVSKTALSGVIRALTAEFASKNIRINGVAPGWIDTDLYRQATQGDLARQQKILSRIATGALGEPQDIGWTCAFLASNAAKYITGQVLLVDGGAAAGF
ncbi:SDR family NAD(P)-dependent oxidoreductase [Cohaesibacter celericrescens]|nr:SDR family oxidoreductase [Cohaesibacter celericrescens]